MHRTPPQVGVGVGWTKKGSQVHEMLLGCSLLGGLGGSPPKDELWESNSRYLRPVHWSFRMLAADCARRWAMLSGPAHSL